MLRVFIVYVIYNNCLLVKKNDLQTYVELRAAKLN